MRTSMATARSTRTRTHASSGRARVETLSRHDAADRVEVSKPRRADRWSDRPFVVFAFTHRGTPISHLTPTRHDTWNGSVHEAQGDVLECRDPRRLAALHVAQRRRGAKQQLDCVDGRFGEVLDGGIARTYVQ